MSMGKGILPDVHELSAGAARSTVLKESDVVMLIGARLNWLLSHGKGKQWGPVGGKKFIQIDIEPREMDSNVEIAAPLVGDVGSCVSALLKEIGGAWQKPPSEWVRTITSKKESNIAKMSSKLMSNTSPMNFHGALGALRSIVAERPDAMLINEGANTLDLARGIIDMYQPRRRLDVGTWGNMGVGMGSAIAAAGRDRQAGAGHRRRQRLRVLRHGGRDDLPLQPADLHRRVQQQRHLPRHRRQPERRGRGDDRVRAGCPLRQDDGGVRRQGRVHVTSPDELKRAVNEAMDSGRPTLINAVIDPAAGSESGNIGSLNPQSALKKKQ